MKQILVFFFSLCSFTYLSSQCTECPAGSTLISGTANITDQNNAIDYCISADWTGTIIGIGPGASLTICPGVTWTLSNNLTIQKGITIDNYGTITDGTNNVRFLINSNQLTFTNHSSGNIDVDFFENQDANFINHGILTAADIYLHGPSTNTGTINSTADCGGNATQNCGFYIGNKNANFNNSGTVNTVDATLADGVIGGLAGTFNVSGTLFISSNGAATNNSFFVNNLSLTGSTNLSSGSFEVSGNFNCNNSTISAAICYDNGAIGSMCQGNTDPGIACSTVPVDIIDFTIQQINNTILLNWEVVNEYNLDHYTIEYSEDGKAFRSVAELEAKNHSFYNWTMQKPIVSGSSYFRLSSTDLDGTVQYYDQILSIKNSDELRYSISPNPVAQQESLMIRLENTDNYLISIMNSRGQILASKFYKDSDNINFDLESIKTSGLYFITISTDTKTFTEQIIIN